MCVIDTIIKMRDDGMERVHAFKRTRIRKQASSVSLRDLPKGVWDVKMKIQEMAEQEELMNRYEHGLEVA